MESDDTIYLTFDDGPTREVTPWVLNELDKVNGKATFFCLGEKLKKEGSLAKEMIKCGHTLGNHTYHHLNGWKSDDERYLHDIELCDGQLARLEVKTPLFRPPYGRITPRQAQQLHQKQIIMWSYLSWDFSFSFKEQKTLETLLEAGAGDIVLFHDSQKAFLNLKRILPRLLDHYKSQGLRLGVLK